MERRLAAVFIAEVADDDRLTGETGAGAPTTPKVDFREFIDPKIAEHRGRVTGGLDDVVVAEFAKAVDAVEFGVGIQRDMAKGNAGVAEKERLELRIGINLCEFLVDGDEIYGDGICVAARLLTSADPGGLCVSGTAFDDVETKLDVGFEFLWEHKPKNLLETIRAYRVLI